MSGEIIVWNTDARNRPELEVEIQIVTSPADVPGEHYARSSPGLEVELLMVESLELPLRADQLFTAGDLAQWMPDALFDLADDDAPVGVIYDAPPQGYRSAYIAA